jgi:hypothetical protein
VSANILHRKSSSNRVPLRPPPSYPSSCFHTWGEGGEVGSQMLTDTVLTLVLCKKVVRQHNWTSTTTMTQWVSREGILIIMWYVYWMYWSSCGMYIGCSTWFVQPKWMYPMNNLSWSSHPSIQGRHLKCELPHLGGVSRRVVSKGPLDVNLIQFFVPI